MTSSAVTTPTVAPEAMADLAQIHESALHAAVAERDRRAHLRAALIHSTDPSAEDILWQTEVREAMNRAAAQSRDDHAARAGSTYAAISDLQFITRPWAFQRVNVTPGHVGTVNQQNGEAHVGLGLYFTTGAAGGAAEMGAPFRLPAFSDFEIRTTVDYNYDWYFSTAAGGADSKGYIEVFVDELLDAPGSAWHNILDKRLALWEDDTGSFGSDGHTDPGNRWTVQERFRGRPDASYVWWIGAHESIQTELQGSSQANLYVDVTYPVVIARV